MCVAFPAAQARRESSSGVCVISVGSSVQPGVGTGCLLVARSRPCYALTPSQAAEFHEIRAVLLLPPRLPTRPCVLLAQSLPTVLCLGTFSLSLEPLFFTRVDIS